MKKISRYLGIFVGTFALTASWLLAQQPGFVNWSNQHIAYQHADFTDANAAGLQNIPGLAFYLPAGIATTYAIDCDIYYSQATVVADGFGIQFSVAPTNAQGGGMAFTNVTAVASITPPTITTNAATTIVTMTPAVTTVLLAHIWFTAEIPAGATDTLVNLSVSQSTAANVIVIKRGSKCQFHSMN